MNHEPVRRFKGERGTALVLAIAFMVVIGGIAAATISSSTSGLQDRAALDQARNREYAADGAIETTVATARGASGVCPAASTLPKLNKVSIHVDCSRVPAVVVAPDGSLRLQNDLSFAACLQPPSGPIPCTPATTIINAQVNFQGAAPAVTTFVQAWSVNR